MKVLLVRHAEAVPRGADRPDDWRELTEAGRRQARKLGKRLRACGEQWDAIVSSPLVRAIQTAELVACGLRYRGPIAISGVLISGSGTWQAYLEAARGCRGAQLVALVGHDPDLSAIASEVMGQAIQLPKGGLLALDVDARGRAREIGYFAATARKWATIGVP